MCVFNLSTTEIARDLSSCSVQEQLPPGVAFAETGLAEAFLLQ